jgi:hypothetical protein
MSHDFWAIAFNDIFSIGLLKAIAYRLLIFAIADHLSELINEANHF